MIIAIDGPAGAGKSTIAREVAQRLGFQLVDTGAIYRSLGLLALEKGISLDDADSLAHIGEDLSFEFRMTQSGTTTICNGRQMGADIRTPKVSDAASRVSALPAVRAAVLEAQRSAGRARDSVLEGRDIGTVVFPDADVKVFLTASDTERARRRTEQLRASGQAADYDEILSDIRERDERDSTREAAPLKAADDATRIDSTAFTIEQVVEQIVALAK